MISHQHRCIFVHIPKTAGNSINRVFGIDWQDHKDLARYAAEQPEDVFQGYFKFAIVRNPWDRLFSDYNYQRKKSRAKDSKLFLFNESGRQRNFAAWIETALAQASLYAPKTWGGEVSPEIHRWSPQLDWITVGGKPSVDYVARMEHLSADFPIVCQQVGIPIVRLPHRNRRLHWHYSHYYDRSTREIVADYYAQDIAAFGYDFEDRTLRRRLFLARAEADRSERRPAAVVEQMRPPSTPPREMRSSISIADRRRPPSHRSRLTAALAVGIITVGSWLSAGFLSSPGAGAPEALADAERSSQSFHRILQPLGPEIIRPAARPPETIGLVSKLHLAATMAPPITPFAGFASLAEVSFPGVQLRPRPARAPNRFSAPSPVFAMHRDWALYQRLKRTP